MSRPSENHRGYITSREVSLGLHPALTQKPLAFPRLNDVPLDYRSPASSSGQIRLKSATRTGGFRLGLLERLEEVLSRQPPVLTPLFSRSGIKKIADNSQETNMCTVSVS